MTPKKNRIYIVLADAKWRHNHPVQTQEKRRGSFLKNSSIKVFFTTSPLQHFIIVSHAWTSFWTIKCSNSDSGSFLSSRNRSHRRSGVNQSSLVFLEATRSQGREGNVLYKLTYSLVNSSLTASSTISPFFKHFWYTNVLVGNIFFTRVRATSNNSSPDRWLNNSRILAHFVVGTYNFV